MRAGVLLRSVADPFRRVGEGALLFVMWIGEKTSWFSRFIRWLFMIDEFLATAPGRDVERKVITPVLTWLDRLLSRWNGNR